MVEPHEEEHPIGEGQEILLASRHGNIFLALGEADGITPRYDALLNFNSPLPIRRD